MKPLTQLVLLLQVLVFSPVTLADVPKVLHGDYGLSQFNGSRYPQGTVFDARTAKWTFQNSRNPNPSEACDCNCGSGQVQRYPVLFRGGPAMGRFEGGVVKGETPRESLWSNTYCNGAAISALDVPGFSVTGVRIDGSWDGIRMNSKPGGKNSRAIHEAVDQVRNVWITNNRDDCIENDDNSPLDIRNSLLDGCFVGVSVDPPPSCASDERCAGQLGKTVIRITGVLIRSQGWNYASRKLGMIFPAGRKFHQVQIKVERASAQIAIYDSVLAGNFFHPQLFNRTQMMWKKIDHEDCGNNYFLWLSDDPWPPSEYPIASIPSCFSVKAGQQAREHWEESRANWIEAFMAQGKQ